MVTEEYLARMAKITLLFAAIVEEHLLDHARYKRNHPFIKGVREAKEQCRLLMVDLRDEGGLPS